tara:strand:+ start:2539 stop:2865 length:327 start_codon:yes stop_codon:yes gene_type:complete
MGGFETVNHLSPWQEYGLIGLIIGAVLGLFGWVLRQLFAAYKKQAENVIAEQKRRDAEHNATVTTFMTLHKEERDEWRQATDKVQERTIRAVDRFSDAVTDALNELKK